MKKRVENLKAKGITPGLAVVLVGNNPASQTYVNNKTKTCERLGMYSVMIELWMKMCQKMNFYKM